MKTHAGLIAAIGSTYVQTGELAPEHGGALNRAEELCEEVEYTICRTIGREEAASVIARAKEFALAAELIAAGNGK